MLRPSINASLGWTRRRRFLEKYFGGQGDHSARQYELYDGIYPASDSASAGYARGALVAYWANLGGWYDGADALSGKDKMSD